MDLDNLKPEVAREKAQAAIARWNILFPLEDNSAWQRVVAEARAQQLSLAQELILLDETALAAGRDMQTVAMQIVMKQAKWLGMEFVTGFLADAKRENEEACAYLKSLKAQDKER